METLELTEQVLELEEGSRDGNTHQSVCEFKKVDWKPSPPIRQRGLMGLITRALTSHGWIVVDEADLGLILFFPGGLQWSFVLFHHYQLNLSWIRSTVSPPSLKMLSFRGDRFNFLTSSRLRSQTCISTCRQRSRDRARIQTIHWCRYRETSKALPAATRGRGYYCYPVGIPSISGGNL